MCAAPFVWGACLEDYSWRYSLPKSADVLKVVSDTASSLDVVVSAVDAISD